MKVLDHEPKQVGTLFTQGSGYIAESGYHATESFLSLMITLNSFRAEKKQVQSESDM